jgi:hypothetical protein
MTLDMDTRDMPILRRLREECDALGSQARWADQHGVSSQYVSDILAGHRIVSDKIAEVLGFRRVWVDMRSKRK